MMATSETHVIARPTIGTIDCLLTFRAGPVGAPQRLDAYSLGDVTLQLEGASLDAAVAPYGGSNPTLIGVVDGDVLPREPGGAVLPGRTLVVLETNTRSGAAQRIRSFGVSSDPLGERRLVQLGSASDLSRAPTVTRPAIAHGGAGVAG